jgi:signal transduction histidine kinase/PAS domain-containing protein
MGDAGGGFAQVRASEFRYRQIVANLPNMSVLSFDRDLRLQVAVGEVLDRGGYDPDAMRGRRLVDVLPVSAMALLQGHYRAALDGHESDFEYCSPITGRQYRMRVRPVLDDRGEVVGGLALTEDITEDKARQAQLEHLHQLSNVGGGWYDAATGWRFDAELRHLLGVDTEEEVVTAMDRLVVTDDRADARATIRGVLACGGRCTVQYRLRHGKSGQLRHAQATCQAVVDKDGKLMRAVLTHVDITDAVNAQESVRTAQAAAAQARTALLRQVSDTLVGKPLSLDKTLQRITDLAAAAAGDGAELRVLTPDGQSIEWDLVSHADDAVRGRIVGFLGTEAAGFAPAAGLHEQVLAHGRLLTSIGNTDWRTELEQLTGRKVWTGVEHFVLAPVRHEGRVLGFLNVFRSDPDVPYEPGDDDLVQILADRVGAAIAESRTRQEIAQQRAAGLAIGERLTELTRDQQDLLDYLTEVEQRERTLLAEAIHDEPMQLIIATIMQMDILSGEVSADHGQHLAELVDTLESSVEKLRTLMVALTPPDLTEGLGVALLNLANGIFAGTTTTINRIGPRHVGLTPATKTVAYRILREALVNARKHAQARNITVSLDETDDTVTARLIDDGVGSDSLNAGPGHLGITTMRVRAAHEGATLEIHSAPGQGTTVALTLPKPGRGQPTARRNM